MIALIHVDALEAASLARRLAEAKGTFMATFDPETVIRFTELGSEAGAYPDVRERLLADIAQEAPPVSV